MLKINWREKREETKRKGEKGMLEIWGVDREERRENGEEVILERE